VTVRLLGIDLAPGEVRIARAERRLGRVRLTATARVPVADGELPAVLASVARAGRAHVLTALPASAVAHRVLALPFRDRARLARTVPLELAGRLAADLDDAVVAFERLSTDERGTTVLAVAARRAEVAERAAALASAGLAPARIDASPLPAWRLVAADAGDAALVLADGAQSSVSVRRDGEVVGSAPRRATRDSPARCAGRSPPSARCRRPSCSPAPTRPRRSPRR
jgi:Tfp pilus assembly PilM family ATPase